MALATAFAWSGRAEEKPGNTAALTRGSALFFANCSMCHGATGAGVPGLFPPLAGSDWLPAHRDGALRAVVSGLNEEITVNGTRYHGQMPPIMLDDAQVADTLTFVANSWGNTGPAVTADDVRQARTKTSFKTFEELKKAADYRPLPPPPQGFTIREVARLPDFGVRLAGDGKGGPLYVLGQAGAVWRLDPDSGNLKQTIWPKDFVGLKPSDFQTLGVVRDAEGRLWITVNQRVPTRPNETNEVSIFRTTEFNPEGDPITPRLWFRTSYPWGVSYYNHGVSAIRFGPDGLLYVSSGSRTDAGEPGKVEHFATVGETEITAAMWRFDPKATEPKLEVIARGIRNAYSFGWDGDGNLFTVSNGPDAHAPEEMDHVIPPKAGEQPRHHGFPYQFGDRPAETKWYPHTPAAPPGMTFVLPVMNVGPAGLMEGKPTSTFHAHSSPAGIVWLDGSWPESVRNGFLIGRFGSLLFGPLADEEAGFDVLHVRLERKADGGWIAHTNKFLGPLGRPIDLILGNRRNVYLLEYTRPSTLKGGTGWLPGRVLELKVPAK